MDLYKETIVSINKLYLHTNEYYQKSAVKLTTSAKLNGLYKATLLKADNIFKEFKSGSNVYGVLQSEQLRITRLKKDLTDIYNSYKKNTQSMVVNTDLFKIDIDRTNARLQKDKIQLLKADPIIFKTSDPTLAAEIQQAHNV
jgi:malic enzyme